MCARAGVLAACVYARAPRTMAEDAANKAEADGEQEESNRKERERERQRGAEREGREDKSKKINMTCLRAQQKRMRGERE